MMRGHLSAEISGTPCLPHPGLLSSLSCHLEGMWSSRLEPPEGAADGAGVGSRGSPQSRSLAGPRLRVKEPRFPGARIPGVR